MTKRLDDQLAGLAAMLPGQLRIDWRRHFRAAPPDLTNDLMRRFIAWKLQVKLHGDVDTRVRGALQAIISGDGSRAGPARPKPGTRIVREWNGKLITVLVTEDGYSHQDRTYGSLSEIAREVTGAHWSGPRFFGLHRKKAKSND